MLALRVKLCISFSKHQGYLEMGETVKLGSRKLVSGEFESYKVGKRGKVFKGLQLAFVHAEHSEGRDLFYLGFELLIEAWDLEAVEVELLKINFLWYLAIVVVQGLAETLKYFWAF